MKVHNLNVKLFTVYIFRCTKIFKLNAQMLFAEIVEQNTWVLKIKTYFPENLDEAFP